MTRTLLTAVFALTIFAANANAFPHPTKKPVVKHAPAVKVVPAKKALVVKVPAPVKKATPAKVAIPAKPAPVKVAPTIKPVVKPVTVLPQLKPAPVVHLMTPAPKFYFPIYHAHHYWWTVHYKFVIPMPWGWMTIVL
ncbi:MAG TPA: hypothetical protein VHR66_20055 [Gemmataceae bacterium]|jgi:hypothetical protein|nr:hypothetical protein [Gemmataceae bacterium]